MFRKQVNLVFRSYNSATKFYDVQLQSSGLQSCRHSSGLSYRHQVGSAPLKYAPMGAMLSEAADKWPDRPAVISRHEDKTLTFSQLLQESDKLAASLRSLGLEKGDRLGIWMPNCTQWIVAMMAASRAGLISVALNHMYGENEIEYALHKVGVKALITSGSRVNSKYYNILNQVIPALARSKPGDLKAENLMELKTVILADDDNDSPGIIKYENLIKCASYEEMNKISSHAHRINPDSACNIQYTSGTTGHPKAVLLSHQGIVNNGWIVGSRNEIADKKVCVQVPLFHVYGIVITISAALQHGATLVLPSASYSPKANLNALLAEKCQVIHGTPTMHIDLVNEVRSRGVASGLESQIAVTGGAPVTPKLVQDLADVLKVSRVKSVFGMTEATAVTFQSVPGEDSKRPLNYLGILNDHLEAKIVDENNELVPFGKPGELLTRGYSNMMCYWGDEGKTKETICENGWLRSGDQVILHEDGYGQVVGRLKDLIIRGGENISPKEIEDVMSAHADVLECQVFGIQDDRLGEEICAVVRLKEGVDFNPEALSKHALERLAKFKTPKLIKNIDIFPKTVSGKVQKHKLRSLVESGKL